MHWRAVTALVSALVEEQRIEGDRVEAIIDTATYVDLGVCGPFYLLDDHHSVGSWSLSAFRHFCLMPSAAVSSIAIKDYDKSTAL